MIEQRTFGRKRIAVLARAAMAGVLLAAGAAQAGAVGPERVVLRAARKSGASLASAERRVVEEVLVARAWEAGVVVCRDGAAASPETRTFAALCAKPGREVKPFWWDLRLETAQHEGHQVASATLRLALSEGPQRGAPEILLLGPFVLPPGLAETAAKAAALRVVTDSLRSSPALLAWLQELAGRADLLHVRIADAGPDIDSPGADPKPMAEPPPAAEDVRAWTAEVLHITDLMIDGGHREAREAVERADRLLRDSRLPADLAARARALKEKAEVKLAGAVTTDRDAGHPAAEVTTEAKDESEPGSGRAEAAFPVRLAVAGQGFAGPDGRLRITREGISFHRNGRAGADWSLGWADLASAGRDEGLWESPFTILLIEREGRKRYLSLTDGHGRYVAGGPLLSAIANGQKAFRRGAQGGSR